MSKRNKKARKVRSQGTTPPSADEPEAKGGVRRLYDRACSCAARGQISEARRFYNSLPLNIGDPHLRALLANDRAALATVSGDLKAGQKGFRDALTLDPGCEPARANLGLVEAELARARQPEKEEPSKPEVEREASNSRVKVAIVSFLFNWPSTGGGIVHTFELARFLSQAGYSVKLIHARYPPWGIGGVSGPLPFDSMTLQFDESGWTLENIQASFRRAVDDFCPDHVILTDSWNIKPRLAEALRGYRVLLRLQGMECLCPLNNVRLLPEPGGNFRQCPLAQVSDPDDCARCVGERGHLSGGLHQAERALSGFGTPGYQEALMRSLREAEAVLVVNPLTETLLRPHANRVLVVTSGMDPARFPWPWPEEANAPAEHPLTLFFAGLVQEWMKGFHVLHEACALLWHKRRDFQLFATGDPPGQVDEFTNFVGWQSQEDLPRHLRAADVVVLPTIAQEALGRTAVEAMGVGRPVIASRLGGLPATVVEGVTGLLAEPGNPSDLAEKIELLLDDAELRQRMGLAGRQRFEEHYSWDIIIERHYKPLLGAPARTGKDSVGASP